MMHAIVEEGLVSQSFIDDRTSGYEELRNNLAGHSPEAMAPVCGIPAQTIREVARLYATSKGSMILWGMGISQHVHGTDNARCLIALSMMTGQVGRPGTGLHPLRGQNNVQGASDAGLIPMMFPDYRRVDNAGARDAFQALWGSALDPKPGLTWSRSWMRCMRARSAACTSWARIRRCPIPDVGHARAALGEARDAGRAGHLPHRDAYLADVILPASAFPRRRARSPIPTAWSSSGARRSRRRAKRGRTWPSSSRWRGGSASTGGTTT
jgi:formate dehydrogenase major subunit